jgi:hypothetical protein
MPNASDTALVADEFDIIVAWFMRVLREQAEIRIAQQAMEETLEVLLGPRGRLTFGILRESFDAREFVLEVAETAKVTPPKFLVKAFASFVAKWSPSVPQCNACRLPAMKPNKNRSDVDITAEPNLCPWCEKVAVIAHVYNPTILNWVTRSMVADDEEFDISTGQRLPVSERELAKTAPSGFVAFLEGVTEQLTLAEFLWYVMEVGHEKFGLPKLAVEVYRAFTSNEYLNRYGNEYLRQHIVLAVRFWEGQKKMADKTPLLAMPTPPVQPAVLAVEKAAPPLAAPVAQPSAIYAALVPGAGSTDPRDAPLAGAWLSERALSVILEALQKADLVKRAGLLEQNIPKAVLSGRDYGFGGAGVMQRLRVLNFAGRLPDGQIPLAILLRNALIEAGVESTSQTFHEALHGLELRTREASPASSSTTDMGLVTRSPEQWKTSLTPGEQDCVRALATSINTEMDERGPEVQAICFTYRFKRGGPTVPQQRVRDVIINAYTRSTQNPNGWKQVKFDFESGDHVIKFFP